MGNEKRCEDCRHAHKVLRRHYCTALKPLVVLPCVRIMRSVSECGPTAKLFEPKQEKRDER